MQTRILSRSHLNVETDTHKWLQKMGYLSLLFSFISVESRLAKSNEPKLDAANKQKSIVICKLFPTEEGKRKKVIMVNKKLIEVIARLPDLGMSPLKVCIKS